MLDFAELGRRNVVRVAILYCVSAWVLTQIAEILFPVLDIPAWGLQAVTVMVIVTFPFVVFFAWAHELTPSGLRRIVGVDPKNAETHVYGTRVNILRVATIYAVGAFALMQVADIVLPALRISENGLRLVLAIVILVFPFVVLFAWVYALTPGRWEDYSETDQFHAISHTTRSRLNFLTVFLAFLGLGLFSLRNSITETLHNGTLPTQDAALEVEYIQKRNSIIVGAKYFIESSILAEIIATTIQNSFDDPPPVQVVHNIPETTYCKERILDREIDIYPEYSGTMCARLCRKPLSVCRNRPRHRLGPINKMLLENCQRLREVAWVADFGFHNGYSLIMSRDRVIELGLDPSRTSVSEVAAVSIATPLTLTGGPEALVRPDCGGGIQKVYTDLRFRQKIVEHDHTNVYQRLLPAKQRTARGLGQRADIGIAFTTDYNLLDPRYVVLRDDRGFFIPYFAGPLVHRATLQRFPDLQSKLLKLNGVFGETANSVTDRELGNRAMQALLKRVSQAGITVAELEVNPSVRAKLREIVAEWLTERGVIGQ